MHKLLTPKIIFFWIYKSNFRARCISAVWGGADYCTTAIWSYTCLVTQSTCHKHYSFLCGSMRQIKLAIR